MSTERAPLLHQQLLGDGAEGGGDAKKVGAAGPGGDVEDGLVARGGEPFVEHSLGGVDLDVRERRS